MLTGNVVMTINGAPVEGETARVRRCPDGLYRIGDDERGILGAWTALRSARSLGCARARLDDGPEMAVDDLIAEVAK